MSSTRGIETWSVTSASATKVTIAGEVDARGDWRLVARPEGGGRGSRAESTLTLEQALAALENDVRDGSEDEMAMSLAEVVRWSELVEDVARHRMVPDGEVIQALASEALARAAHATAERPTPLSGPHRGEGVPVDSRDIRDALHYLMEAEGWLSLHVDGGLVWSAESDPVSMAEAEELLGDQE